jgi:hypothetical protein
MLFVTVHGTCYVVYEPKTITIDRNQVFANNVRLREPTDFTDETITMSYDEKNAPEQINIYVSGQFDGIQVNNIVIKKGKVFVDGIEYIKKEDPYENAIMLTDERPNPIHTHLKINNNGHKVEELRAFNCTLEVEDFLTPGKMIIVNSGIRLNGDVRGDVIINNGRLSCKNVFGNVTNTNTSS